MSIILLITPIILAVLSFSILYIVNREIVAAKVKQALSDNNNARDIKMPDLPIGAAVVWITGFVVITTLIIGLMHYNEFEEQRKHERIEAGIQVDIELLKDELIKILNKP